MPLVAKVAWCFSYVAYFMIRYPRMRRSRKTATVKRFDGARETVLMGISYTGLFVVPVIYLLTEQPKFADYPFHALQAWVGLILLAVAMVLLYRTHRDLGRHWSMTLELRHEHRLVTNGIYHKLRHPMYSAFWLWAFAQAFLFPNWVAGLAGLFGFGVLFFARIGREEKMMLEQFGDDYRAYKARTSRIIPGIY